MKRELGLLGVLGTRRAIRNSKALRRRNMEDCRQLLKKWHKEWALHLIMGKMGRMGLMIQIGLMGQIRLICRERRQENREHSLYQRQVI